MLANADVLRDLEALGAPDDVLAAVRSQVNQAQDCDDLDIFEDCATSVQVFLELGTQWEQHIGFNGAVLRLCLPMDRARAWIETTQPRRSWRKLLRDVQTMERAVLDYDAEQRALKQGE